MAQQFLSDFLHTPILPAGVVALHPGDNLDQPTFHQRYEKMPDGYWAELIEGVVIVSSPLSTDHADCHAIIMTWLGTYRAATPGTRSLDNASIILGPSSEPQPDASLLILPELGGQTRAADCYTAGPPELIVEVAYSSEAYDLHGKYRDYQKAGVREYVVVLLAENRVEWFVREADRFQPLAPSAGGIHRSAIFPGLWLDAPALSQRDAAKVLATLQIGLAHPDHTVFLGRLQSQRGSR